MLSYMCIVQNYDNWLIDQFANCIQLIIAPCTYPVVCCEACRFLRIYLLRLGKLAFTWLTESM